MRNHQPLNQDFRCLHCRYPVTAISPLSGVRNRNHCPYCLSSRHMDLFEPGDRLAACRSVMQPIGLTVKRSNKKYARHGQGELMLIHLCASCGQLSINRIAADDDPEMVNTIYTRSAQVDNETRIRLERLGIQLLTARDAIVVQTQLFGIM
jgi:DNA-directed RNA polymerase subunit RPC12/RpoP